MGPSPSPSRWIVLIRLSEGSRNLSGNSHSWPWLIGPAWTCVLQGPHGADIFVSPLRLSWTSVRHKWVRPYIQRESSHFAVSPHSGHNDTSHCISSCQQAEGERTCLFSNRRCCPNCASALFSCTLNPNTVAGIYWQIGIDLQTLLLA